MPERKKQGDMSVRDAGRKGGETTSERHGHEFYEEIGHMGGEAGGKKGGEARKRELGHEGYEELGHQGGQRVKELVEEGKEAEEKR